MYLVDTNVLSEARRKSSIALRWTRSADPASVYLSVITLGEITRRIIAKRRRDPKAADGIQEWLRWIRDRHTGRILPITDRIVIEWGRVAAIRPRGEADALIAAIAIVHDLVVVTRNARDFTDTGAEVLDPWEQV